MDAMMGIACEFRDRSFSPVVERRSFRCNLHYNYARVCREYEFCWHVYESVRHRVYVNFGSIAARKRPGVPK